MQIDRPNATARLYMPALLLCAIALAGLALARHGPIGFDAPLLLWFRAGGDPGRVAGPAWMLGVWEGLSWLGNTLPRVMGSLLTMLVLWRWRRRAAALFLAAVMLSATALSTALKAWIDRPRPQLVSHLDLVTSASFPSGHALVGTVFYLSLALLLAPLLRAPAARRALIGLAVVLAAATGMSRVALGVHWPSDVLGGWALGGAWLCLSIAAARRYWPQAMSSPVQAQLHSAGTGGGK